MTNTQTAKMDPKTAVDKALDRLINDLEAGHSDTLKTYLSTMATFHRYSFGNQLLIYCQRPDATLVAGFRKWLSLGRHVKRGEHGIQIIAPRSGKAKETDRETGEEKEREYTYFTTVAVFDYSQTDGEPLPEPSRVGGNPGLYLSTLHDYITDLGIQYDEVDTLGFACSGRSYGGRIEVDANLDPAAKFAVTVHETAHELLHRNLTPEQRRDTRRIETEAESVAYIVCDAIGLDTNKAAPDYLALYQSNKAVLRDSLETIQKTAQVILKGIGVGDRLPAAEPREYKARTPKTKKTAKRTVRSRKVAAA